MGKLEALAIFAIVAFYKMLGYDRRSEVLPVSDERRNGKGRLTMKIAKRLHDEAVEEALKLRDFLK